MILKFTPPSPPIMAQDVDEDFELPPIEADEPGDEGTIEGEG